MPHVNSPSGAAPAKARAEAPALAIALAWPPLIRWTQVPWIIRVRDLLLTFMAWLCYAVILRRPIVAIIAWVSPALGARIEMWLPMDYSVDSGPYLVVAAVLVLALLLAGLRRRSYLRLVPGSQQEEALPLSAEMQFGFVGLPVAQEALWRSAQRLDVRFLDSGQIESAGAANAVARDR